MQINWHSSAKRVYKVSSTRTDQICTCVRDRDGRVTRDWNTWLVLPSVHASCFLGWVSLCFWHWPFHWVHFSKWQAHGERLCPALCFCQTGRLTVAPEAWLLGAPVQNITIADSTDISKCSGGRRIQKSVEKRDLFIDAHALSFNEVLEAVRAIVFNNPERCPRFVGDPIVCLFSVHIHLICRCVTPLLLVAAFSALTLWEWRYETWHHRPQIQTLSCLLYLLNHFLITLEDIDW